MLSSETVTIDAATVANRIVEFIRQQVVSSGLKGAVVAVSGGLDSATTLALTARALGNDRVRAVTMPERDVTPEDDVMDVMQLTKMLDVTCDVVEITSLMDAMRSILPLYEPADLIATGNLKPRIRMTIAYHFANALRSMVIGSSNKTEWLTGYFTKYGDGASDLMPLADLYKTQVRQLARHLGIPKEIVEKAPSARLWPGQTSEDELGVKFETLDLILHGWEHGMHPNDIAEELSLGPSTVLRILERVRNNEHKRRLPLILRLSSAQG